PDPEPEPEPEPDPELELEAEPELDPELPPELAPEPELDEAELEPGAPPELEPDPELETDPPDVDPPRGGPPELPLLLLVAPGELEPVGSPGTAPPSSTLPNPAWPGPEHADSSKATSTPENHERETLIASPSGRTSAPRLSNPTRRALLRPGARHPGAAGH
ncbi:MAG TPA: hypothetical protein VE987_20485, partial [Polyangiaceae bacterium]|nr:hypothetical protein [Polyangiaceae bacterium]